MTLTPKNWSGFQHYKDRSPAWIKLHRGLLDDFDFHRLPVASRALAPMLWLLASEYKDGGITASIEEMAFRFRLPADDLEEALRPLIDKGFFIASGLLAEREQNAIPEEEREIEEEKRKNADAFAPALGLPSPEVDYFRRVKEICGASAGGLAKKLLDAKDGNIALARAAAEQASTKHDPREYLGGVIRNRGSPEDERLARRSF